MFEWSACLKLAVFMDKEYTPESILCENEFEDFCQEIKIIASRNARIMGVLAIGSMVQTETPDDFYIPLRSGRLSSAYETVRRPLRRKIGPSRNSDLDIWVCTKDNDFSRKSRRIVELGGMALLEELAAGTLKKGTNHWRNKKLEVFGRYYKKTNLYDLDSGDIDREPWMAHDFKRQVEDAMIKTMPKFVERVNETMNKRIPGDFIEVRAFPESLFHLRPDESNLEGGIEDRAPFPRIADEQWISAGHNAFVFYAREGVSIYPFVEDGDVLGSRIDRHIRRMENIENNKTSIGGILLKPDALTSGQLEIIKEKIAGKLNEYGGKIIQERLIDKLTEGQIETLYPLINPDDLRELRDYLQSGSVIAMLVELPSDPFAVFQIVNSIKGPRVGDRPIERLYEGRRTDLAVRDLLPLPGDEGVYGELIDTILKRRSDPTVRFSDAAYRYYSRNLMHTPDNSIELGGLVSLANGSSNKDEDY